MIVQKGGQVTKPIIVVKMPCKLLYVIQVKGFIKCSTSWPYSISEVLVAYNHCWFMRGRIKEKIDTIYAIKHQVYCIANTAEWLANTVLLF